MFEVHKPKQKSVVVIRAATAAEFSNYEKRKLANIEENAQENKIEVVSLNVDGISQKIAPLNKEIEINLGTLALKSSVTEAELSPKDIFIIECELDESVTARRD